MWKLAAASGVAGGVGSYLDYKNQKRQAEAHNKNIEKRIRDNKGTANRLGIDARVAQDWAANQLVKHRNNPNNIGAIENMYNNKMSNTSQNILALSDENSKLKASKVKTQSGISGFLGSLISGAGSAAKMYAATAGDAPNSPWQDPTPTLVNDTPEFNTSFLFRRRLKSLLEKNNG